MAAWQVAYNGRIYRETDLTLSDCVGLEKLTGKDWLSLNPIQSATQAQMLTAFLVSKYEGRAYDEVFTEIGEHNALTFISSWVRPETDDMPTMWEDGFPPKAAEPSTVTS